MFGVNTPEVILISLLVLVVFGPARLPGLARELAALERKIRRAAEDLSAAFVQPDNYPDEWFASGPKFQEVIEETRQLSSSDHRS